MLIHYSILILSTENDKGNNFTQSYGNEKLSGLAHVKIFTGRAKILST